MTINVNLNDGSSIEKAIDDLKEYQRELEAKIHTFAQRVGALGLTVVTGAYSAAMYAGTNDITVSLESTANGCVIKAAGSSLGFIEFGTGVYSRLGESAAEVGAPPHGSYGKHQGNNPNGWFYKGEPGNLGVQYGNHAGVYHTYGNPAADAFALAKSQILSDVDKIAQEVFG